MWIYSTFVQFPSEIFFSSRQTDRCQKQIPKFDSFIFKDKQCHSTFVEALTLWTSKGLLMYTGIAVQSRHVFIHIINSQIKPCKCKNSLTNVDISNFQTFYVLCETACKLRKKEENLLGAKSRVEKRINLRTTHVFLKATYEFSSLICKIKKIQNGAPQNWHLQYSYSEWTKQTFSRNDSVQTSYYPPTYLDCFATTSLRIPKVEQCSLQQLIEKGTHSKR